MPQVKKRKKFFDVDMPIIDKQTQLMSYELAELDGRIIKYDLTRILRGKSVILQLKVNIKGDKATSTPIKLQLMPYFLKRAVRKGTDYIEDSFSASCKNAQVKIKPFLITRRKVSRAVKKALREKAKEELVEGMKNKNSEEIFDDILKSRVQKSLSSTLKKIYPLSLCEIRIFEIEKELERKPKAKTEEKPKEPEKKSSEE